MGSRARCKVFWFSFLPAICVVPWPRTPGRCLIVCASGCRAGSMHRPGPRSHCRCSASVAGGWPDMIAPLRLQPHAGAVIEPQTAKRFLLLRNLESFAAPDPFHSIFANLPVGFSQFDGDSAVAIATVLSCQRDDRPGQRVFVVTLCGLIALRAARLVYQLARMTLTCPTLLCMLHSDTAPLRA